MTTLDARGEGRRTASSGIDQLSAEHYLRLIYHRKFLILVVFVVVSVATAIISHRMADIFMSETLILVDPQKVPETYVKATVTGDIRNRLGTLSQQILSATRLQKIIDTYSLFPAEKKTMAREDLITMMRKNISVNMVGGFGGGQDLQAFRITYTGREPRLVAQVTNELASLFIEENLKAREQQASGTSEFLGNQLQETRKALEEQEGKLRDFRLKHIGEMPEQQAADLQIMGQLQSQLQLEGDALNRTEQQKNYIQSMLAQAGAPVVDLDTAPPPVVAETSGPKPPLPKQATSNARTRLAALLSRGYTEKHPDIQKLRREIEQEDKAAGSQASAAPLPPVPPPPVPAPVTESKTQVAAASVRSVRTPVAYVNPVLQSQLAGIEAEISKHKEEKQRLGKLIANYQAKLEVIPVNEQKISELVRDYEMSKAHYSKLLEDELSAQTATQLEIRQKGERFSILDPAQPAEKPARPNRTLINAAGALGGLVFGVLLALCTEFLGISITTAEQIKQISGIPVLEIIPRIETHADRRIRKKRLIMATVSGVAVTLAACGVILVYHFRS
jgi:succinoglycan biosynthesis transport protein ExoP